MALLSKSWLYFFTAILFLYHSEKNYFEDSLVDINLNELHNTSAVTLF